MIRLSRGRFMSAVLLLSLAAVYAPAFGRMAQLWWTYDYAGHGMFVPAFSAVLAWTDRDRLRQSAGRGHPGGLILILLALGLLGAGSLAQILPLQTLSVIGAVAGVILLCFGPATLRHGAFPVGFLFLMAPLPREVVDAVTLDLQLFAAAFAGTLLRVFDIPFFRQGVLIELPDATLQVAEVCNGLRFLLALLTLTLAFAHVTQRGLWRKIVLTAAAIPAAILANAVRVAAIVVAVHYFGLQMTVGVPHYIIGKMVWFATLVPLVGLGLLLRRGVAGNDTRSTVGAATEVV